MDALRTVFKWISKHRILSTIFGILIVSIILFFRFVSERSEGILSDPLRRGKIVESVYGIGTIMANRSYQIKLGVVGTLRDLYVQEGDSVKKGQKLALIDQITYRAPFTGTITSLPFKEGENVFTNIPVLTLVDLMDRYLVVSMEQQGALRVRRGQKAKISFDTIREQNYEGVVQAVYSNENNFYARIGTQFLPARILPGMTADVAITIEEHENSLLIPVAALEQGKFVWIKRGHMIPKRIELKLGIVDKSKAEVIGGEIQEKDQVLIRKKAPT